VAGPVVRGRFVFVRASQRAAKDGHRTGEKGCLAVGEAAKNQAVIQDKNEVIAELMQEHVLFKKVLGKPERTLGSPRYAGCNRGLCPLGIGPKQVP
jgi:hypothetical protein